VSPFSLSPSSCQALSNGRTTPSPLFFFESRGRTPSSIFHPTPLLFFFRFFPPRLPRRIQGDSFFFVFSFLFFSRRERESSLPPPSSPYRHSPLLRARHRQRRVIASIWVSFLSLLPHLGSYNGFTLFFFFFFLLREWFRLPLPSNR